MSTNAKWTIEYNNETGNDDESFWSWWEVSNGFKTFKADTEDDAKWLADVLNAIAEPVKHPNGDKPEWIPEVYM